jgi:mannitol-1-phosphate/altronate dehydrogenase
LAGWARYLGVIDPEEQAFDASGDVARRYAVAALDDPPAFLDYGAVFPAAMKDSERFRSAFADSYRRIEEDGAIAAMEKQTAGGTK